MGKQAKLAAMLGAAILAGGAPAMAQAYPTKPINVIVPYAPGGNTDVVARIVLEHMSQTLGQALPIENIGGAGGTTGSSRAAKAAPDGYTILVGQMGTHGAAPALYPNLSYNPVTDFEHVSQLSDTPIAVFGKKALPANTLQELIALIKADPGKLNNGHGGVGSTSHVSCLLFTAMIGVRPPQVAYRGSGPALNDLISGMHDFMCDQIPHTVPQVLAGNIKAFAIATPERSPAIPNVPTTAEAGMPAFVASGWNAMFAPKGTPKAIVDRLAAAVDAALKNPATRKRLEEIGAVIPAKTGPEALRSLVASEIEKWTPVIKAAGVVAN
ncbi:MAG TPA: tripartite tricarboxylate transporter substrate-binding protein [Bosea sp. (in: a-proteobacteria)]|jgi:tripartite-type tricarboxylate transporter receptor subunit TctC|uniref:Bug family tripartite tricarboxylate transporter substrate binding protein n=1 Tax=Bosea sp. (in: a-proteobacteria) TaxID=1871050 RepID=UPI002E0FB029|nr:tripartite tricarboxylate transporter substrate-binding protein [Bosea sp. (in: a-proteobacteria)]